MALRAGIIVRMRWPHRRYGFAMARRGEEASRSVCLSRSRVGRDSCVLATGLHMRRFSTEAETPPADSEMDAVEPSAPKGMEAWRAVRQIEKLCKKRDPVGAEKILRQVEEHCRQRTDHPAAGLPVPKPAPLACYNQVLFTFAGQTLPREAEALLKTMMRTPDIDSWNCCLTAWQRSRNPKRAHALLMKMMDSGTVKPTTKSFNIVLSAYAKADCVEEATDLLQYMHRYSNQHPQAKVDRVTLTSMLDVLSSRGKADDARAVLESMEFSSDPSLRPDAFLFVHAIQALVTRKREAYILQRDAPDTADRALDLLKFMKERYAVRKDSRIKPDVVVYNAVLNVLAHVGDGERAERVLQRMLRGEDPDGLLSPDDVPLPTAVSYGTVLLAWRNSPYEKAAERAESLLMRIPEPNAFCYTTVISAWAKRGKPKQAENLLDQMQRIHHEQRSEDMLPNTVVVSAVLEAWASSGAPGAVSRIELLLDRMETTGPAPNSVSYNTLVKAIEKSPIDNKAQRASKVLERMNAQGVTPDVRTYNAILRACSAETVEEAQLAALEIAFAVFTESRRVNDLKNCQFSYPAILKCCGNLSPGGKHGYEIVDQVFLWCRNEGKVGGLVLEHLRRACSEEHLKELLDRDDVSAGALEGGKSLPEPWIRNNSYRQALRRKGGWSQRERYAYAKQKYG